MTTSEHPAETADDGRNVALTVTPAGRGPRKSTATCGETPINAVLMAKIAGLPGYEVEEVHDMGSSPSPRSKRTAPCRQIGL
jgi:hypothetical protein